MRSEALKDGQPVKAARRDTIVQSLPWHAAGLFAIVVGGVFWLIGARYTVFGAPIVIARLLALFGIVAPIALPTGWPLLGLTIIVGAVISLLEFGARPRAAYFSQSMTIGLVLLLLWVLANGMDLASTYTGVTTIAAGGGAAAQWVAVTEWAAVVWTTFLTYCPELLILAGVRWLFKGRF